MCVSYSYCCRDVAILMTDLLITGLEPFDCGYNYITTIQHSYMGGACALYCLL